jgi:hypothetical protein
MIKKDFDAKLLDRAISSEDGDEDSDGESWEDEDEDENKNMKVPRVAVWYRNALLREVWETASPSQWEAVEQYQEEEADDDLSKIVGFVKFTIYNSNHALTGHVTQPI